jgi:ElaB/YqjD/DUF883 family membrane-anchored ribosome-binding protein
MAEKRSDLENVDRVDPADHTSETGDAGFSARKTDDTSLDTVDAEELSAASDDVQENDTPPEAEQIREQIEETRNQMGETIDAIQDRLSFSNLSEQVSEHVNNAVETAKDAVYDATIGKAATMMKNLGGELSNTSIVRTAKNNPFPFVLIGLGAGLLAYQSFAGKGKTRRHEFTGNQGRRFEPQTSALDTASGKLSAVTDTVSTAASTAYDKVTGLAETAYTGAGDVVHQAYNKAGELKTTAVEQYDHYIEDNPLAVGAVALALGAAVGMAIPATQYESRLMGDARQGLMDKAQDTAAGLLDRTKEVVVEAGKTITDQAKASMIDH